MCGLVGIVSLKDNGFSNDQAVMLERSMIFNQLRGEDSTGLVSVDKEDNWFFIKSVGGFRSLLRHQSWNEWRSTVLNRGRLVFGHGRAATRGDINSDNAHPFHIKHANGEIIFMHNGTLTQWQPHLKGMYGYDVDSEFLGAQIAELGAEEALSKVNGAIACMWWDVKENKFNFYKNKERPLYFMINKEGELYLNSEKWVLEYLDFHFKMEVKEINQLDDMKLHSVEVNGENAMKYDIKEIKKYISPIATYIPHFSNRDEYDRVYGVRRSSGYPPWAMYEDFLFEEDKEWWDRSIEIIEWKNGEKVVTHHNKTIVTTKEEPPEPLLLRMYEINSTGNIMKVYKKNADSPLHEHPRYVEVKYEDWKKEKKNKKKEVETPVISINTKKDNVRFNTRHPVTYQKIKHRGDILQGHAHPHLQKYENTLDGSVEIGEVKKCEVIYTEEVYIKNSSNGFANMTKVVCSELKPKQDTYIDYVFFTSEFSKKEVEAIGFFQGIVAAIKLTPEAANVSGGVVTCSLSNVKKIEDHINVQQPSVETAEDKGSSTVH